MKWQAMDDKSVSTRTVRLFLLAVSLLTPIGKGVFAQTTDKPVVSRLQAALIDPSAADAYINSTVPLAPNFPAPSQRAEIIELARTLGAGRLSATDYANSVLEYFRYNIDTEFRYGVSKGALGALMDQSGTAFDQAELFVTLLREGALSAGYQAGTVTLSGAQFQSWTGITNAVAACRLFADGGIPAQINGSTSASCSYSGSVSSVTLSHVWVAANGLLYDPSFKPVVVSTAPSDPTAIMQCGGTGCAASARTAALSNAGSSGFDSLANANYVQNVNVASLGSTLNTFAGRIQTHIEANNRYAEVADVVGGRSANLTAAPAVGSTSLPYSNVTVQRSWSSTIPNQYRTQLRVQFDNLDRWFYVDELYPRRLTLWVSHTSSTRSGVLSLRDPVLGEPYDSPTFQVSSTRSGFTIDNDLVTLQIDHPYPAAGTSGAQGTYADELVVTDLLLTQNCRNNSGGVISGCFHGGVADLVSYTGEVGEGMNRYKSKVNGSGYLAGDTVSAWLQQATRAARIIDAINGTRMHRHHALGALAGWDTGGSIIDVRSGFSIVSPSSTSADVQAAFLSMATIDNALEGSVVEEGDAWGPNSSVAMFRFANEKSHRFYETTAANVEAVLARTTQYSNADRNFIRGFVQSSAPTYNVVVPSAGQLGTWTYGNSTVGWIMAPLLAYATDGSRVGYTSTAENKAASLPTGPTSPNGIPLIPTVTKAQTIREQYSHDRYAGAVTYKPVADLVTGSGDFPKSLPFQREFRSDRGAGSSPFLGATFGGVTAIGTSVISSQLPAAWAHNFQIHAEIGGDGDQALGADSALDASAALAVLLTLRDAYRGTPDFQMRIVATFCADWFTRQFIRNGVVLKQGHEVQAFLKLPNGQFNPPPGSGDVMTQTGEPVRRIFAGGLTHAYQAIQLSLRHKDGSVINFSVGHEDYVVNEVYGLLEARVINWFKPDNWIFPDGITVTFTYDSSSTTPVLVEGDPNYRSRLIKVSNSLGRTLNFIYPTPAQLGAGYGDVQIRDESGRTVTFSASSAGDLVNGFVTTSRVTDATGKQTRYEAGTSTTPNQKISLLPTKFFSPTAGATPTLTIEYDYLDRAKRIVDGGNNVTNVYPAKVAGESLSRGESRDASGAVTSEYFDRYGRSVQMVDPINRRISRTYYGSGPLRKETAPEQNATEYVYDARHNIVETRKLAKAGSALPTETIYTTYPVCTSDNRSYCNKPSSTSDSLGRLTEYLYYNNGQLRRVTGPTVTGGNVRTDFCYTTYGTASLLSGLIEAIATGRNRVTAFAYDSSPPYALNASTVDPGTTLVPAANEYAACTTASKSGALALATTYTFDPAGNVRTINGPRTDVADTATYTFDNMRRLRVIEGPAGTGERTEYIYYDDGFLRYTDRQEIVNGASVTRRETRTYYPTGDLQTVTDPQQNLTSYRYDAMGRVTLVKDADLRRTGSVYDAAGQLLCVWKGWASDLAPTHCTWDPAQYATAGNVGAYRYVRYSYTANGQRESASDANNNATYYAYDSQDRLRFTFFPHPAGGERCRLASPFPSGPEFAEPTCPTAAGVAATYEALWYTTDGTASGQRCSGDGKVCRKRLRSGQTVTYTYDAGNRLQTQAATNLATVTYAYDLLNQRLTVTSPAGGTPALPEHRVGYGYDDAGRKQYEESWLAGAFRRVSFGYDRAGNRASLTWPDNYVASYRYDSLNRMKEVWEGALDSGYKLADYTYDELSRRRLLRFASSTSNQTTYEYEPDGNLDVMTHTLESDDSFTFDYDHNNAGQIRTITGDDFFFPPPALAATTAYVPDGLNRYGSVGGQALNYDANGNLLTWTRAGSLQTYTYDALNRLRTAAVNGASTPSATYDYDPLGRRISKVDAGTTTLYLLDGDEEVAELDASGAVLRRYINGPAIDDRIAMIGGGVRRYYHVNHQGSVLAMSNETGDTDCTPGCQRMSYDEYGNFGAGSAATGQPYRFTGRRFDAETGLYYYRARYYAPELGRFLQTDPIGYEDDINLYAYTSNDPVNKVDSRGLGVMKPALWTLDELRKVVTKRQLKRIERAVENGRRRAVKRAWAEEKQLVQKTGEGTREWTKSERKELLETGKVEGYDGHHINDVHSNLKEADNPDNIEFLDSGTEHVAAHAGGTQVPTSGKMVDRTLGGTLPRSGRASTPTVEMAINKILGATAAGLSAVEPVLTVIDQVTDPIFQVDELGCSSITACD